MNQKQKKIVLTLCGIAVLSLIAAGLYLTCGRKSLPEKNPQTDKQVQTKQQENKPQATKNPYEGMVKSELTGKYVKPSVAKKRPYAIMINNIEYAFRNQKGTSKADIIYEALAEGGITRMMAVYEDVSKVKKLVQCEVQDTTMYSLLKNGMRFFVILDIPNMRCRKLKNWEQTI